MMHSENREDSLVDEGRTAENEESFAAMFEKSSGPAERLNRGQKVRAKVVSILDDFVYIDLGGKSEGVIDVGEFLNEDGSKTVHEGDEIDAFFVSVQDGIRRMTTMINGYSALTLESIRGSYEASIPVNGEVKREVKGGFEISVGGVRCFCPFSQIDLRGGREGGIYLGRTFPFKVLEYEQNGKNVIVSRRALLEEEKQASVNELKERLTVGMVVTATIRSVQNFGAFVDLGGIDGMIPASEISWERTENPMSVLSPGQEVTVKIISLDWDRNRLTLSIKATLPDPWVEAAEKYPVDSRVNGTVVRLTPFGAFVRLQPGIDGLVHISNLGAGRRINHPKEVVEVGQLVETYVLAVDPQNRKISLSLRPKVEPKKIILPEVGETVDGVVEKVMPYGVFVKMENGSTGLVPNSEMGTPVGTDHKRMFPAGTEMKAVVIEVDAVQGKVRLSRRAVLEKAVQEEFQEYKDSAKNDTASSGGFGTLGDILKARMEEKKQTPIA
jgi:small subunit ribosomal protein S1